MKKSIKKITYALMFLPLIASANSEITLKEALKLAWKSHPTIEADKNREVASQKEITKSQAEYYPRINAMALATTGFPGSAGATGVGGLMVSPYHKGPSVGVLVEQDIYDFGRTSGAVELARRDASVTRSESKVDLAQIGTRTAKIYYDCVRDKSLAAFYLDLVTESRIVEKEVGKFVASGQRTVVERYLSQSQTEEAATRAATYEQKRQFDENQLALFLSAPKGEITCPSLSEAQNLALDSASDATVSPLLEKAQAEASLAQAAIAHERSNYLPRIVGVASFGYMDSTELNFDKKDYAAGVGFIFPLFEGFRTNAAVEQALAKNMQKEKNVAAIKLALAEENLELDKRIEAGNLEVTHLTEEIQLAEKAYRLSKKRYFANEGSLIDLREAIRNLARTQSELKNTQTEVLEARAQKSLLNGQWLADSR